MTHTGARVWQWVGIILILCLFGGAYWYFQVRASTLNAPQNDLNTNGLVGLWSFNGDDIAGTTAYDRSGQGNNGTLTNGPVKTDGKVGQALSFDGTDDYVNVGTTSTAFDFATNLSGSAWIKTSSNSETVVAYNGNSAIVHMSVGSTTSGGTANKFVMVLRTNSGSSSVFNSNTTVNDNVWHHIAFTRNTSTQKVGLYVDGVLDSESSYTDTDTINTSGGGHRIGFYTTGAYPFSGAIDEVRVYNRALTTSEIQSLYVLGQSDKVNSAVSQPQGTGRLDSGLAGYWKMDDGSGTSATDASTNANTGTLTNGPTWTTGQIGGAVMLDGIDDYISIPDAASNRGSRPMTAVAWVKRDAVGEGDAIFMKRGGTNDGWGLTIGSDNRLSMTFYAIADRYSVSTITDTAWHHIVATVDGSGNLMFYIDGSSAGSTGNFSSSPTTTTQPLRLGVTTTSSGTIDGYQDFSLDEARIYNRALSADEVSQLYRLTSPTGVDTSLKGYWSFNAPDMVSTTAYDRSGAGNTGTLTNGPTITEGKLGQGLNFDGSNDYVSVAAGGGLNNLQTGSISLWVKWIGSQDGAYVGYGPVMARQKNGEITNQLIALNGSDPATAKIVWYPYDSSVISLISTVAPGNGVWRHIVVAYSSGSHTLYIDGQQNTTGSHTGTISNDATVPLSIGAWIGDGNGYSTSTIDEVRIYNRAITASEVASLYTQGGGTKVNTAVSQPQGTGRLDSGLAGYWKLDDGSGTSATDASTNGNTGTLANGPTWTTGQVGGAVDFDGANDVITTSTVIPSAGTVSVWVNTTASISSSQEYTALYATTSGSSFSLSFNGYSSFNEWRLTYRGNYGSTVSVNGPAYTSNAHQGWHLLTATWDVTKGGTLFLDGVAISSGTSTTNAFSSMSLGFSTNSLADWVGKLDEVRLYNRILSPDEVAQLYRLSVPTGTDTSLKGYWSFNGKDVSGTTAYDRSGAGNTGTLTNSPTITEGKLGQALNFDGADDYVTAGSASVIDNIQTLTVSAWIKTRTYSNQPQIFDKAGVGGGWKVGLCQNSIGICANAGQTNAFHFVRSCEGVGTVRTRSPENSISTNTWQHLAITNDNSAGANTTKFYINGSLVATDASACVTPRDESSNNLLIGSANGGGQFDGLIDEARLYNRVLTESEIKALYNSSR